MKIEMNDLSLKDGEERGYMHSRNYPWPKYCHWYLYVMNEDDRIMFARHVTGNEKVMTETFELQATHRGLIMVQVVLRPDCYIDLDVEKNFSFEVFARDPSKKQDDYFIHPDDVEASKSKSIIQDAPGK